jgi:predicted permease
LRIIRQLLTESLLVALLGAAFGLTLAAGLINFVRTLGSMNIPRLDEAGIHGMAFLFALGLALASALLSGLIPAVRSAQVDIQTVLRAGGRNTGLVRDRTRSAYITAEVALALVLLVGAGLIIRTAIAAERVQPGFSPQRLISGRTALPLNAYRNAEQVSHAYRRILENLQRQPEVMGAALTSKAPLTHNAVGLLLKPTSVAAPLKQELATELRYISSGYLATMRISLRKGREFTAHDRSGSAQVILVSDTLARRLWPGGDALGQSVRLPELEGANDQWEVVGIVADARDNGVMSEPPPVLYLPFTQVPTNPWRWVEQSLYLVARTRGNVTNAPGLLRRALINVDPELPLGDTLTMDERLTRSIAVARFYTLALTILGVCGLLLTVAGIYGVVSYFVHRQRAEIGVRLALGSTAPGIVLLVIRQGMRPVLVGVALGLIASTVLARLLAAQLDGVTADDPTILLTVTAILTGVSVMACYLPARRAAQVDPMVALRNE